MNKFPKIVTVTLIFGLLINNVLFADFVEIRKARQVAENLVYLEAQDPGFAIKSGKTFRLKEQLEPLFYVFLLEPCGYVVITTNTNLPPVIAYSFENISSTFENENNPLCKLLFSDIKNRIKNIPNIPDYMLSERNSAWENLLSTSSQKISTKSYGPYVQTVWGQGQPFNNFCPMDPVTNERSIAGCPAVALAQIINYFETLNESVFSDMDDYYHSYAGRNYWIDDDFEEIDFPSFPQLNAYLDTLEVCWENQSQLKENEKAAINFACGVAAKQVYTSSIAGTFGVNQAFDAYIRLGFNEAKLIGENDTSLYTQLLQNMLNGQPAHLAVVDEAGTMGHNVVVDGYDDGYYHLNLGWNGSYNGYYLLPDEIPYGLTVIEGLILNIADPPVYTNISNLTDIAKFEEIHIYPNPANNHITIEYAVDGFSPVSISIYGIDGSLVNSVIKEIPTKGKNIVHMDFNGSNNLRLKVGLYFCEIKSGESIFTGKFIIR